MQQINLYLSEFRQQEPEFSAAIIIICCGYMIFIGILISGILLGVKMKTTSDGIELKAQSQYWAEQMEIAFKQNPEPKIDTRLLDNIENLELRLKRNESVLQYLKKNKLAIQGSRFSQILLSLTWINQEDLWLTKVAIRRLGKSLTLTGRTLNPDALPEYLNKLSQLDAFRNMTFEVFDLKREGKDFKFIVSSEKEEKSIEGFLEKISSQG